MKDTTRVDRLRCRAATTPRNLWAPQCPHPARTERHIDGPEEVMLPVCGTHARARSVLRYRPDPTVAFQQPVAITV